MVLCRRIDEDGVDKLAFSSKVTRSVEVVVSAVAQRTTLRRQCARFQCHIGVHDVAWHFAVRRRDVQHLASGETLVCHVVQGAPCVVDVNSVTIHPSNISVDELAAISHRA